MSSTMLRLSVWLLFGLSVLYVEHGLCSPVVDEIKKNATTFGIISEAVPIGSPSGIDLIIALVDPKAAAVSTIILF